MFRQIANAVKGRKKTVDEKLTYEGLSDFLLAGDKIDISKANLTYLEYDVERTLHVEDFKPVTMSDAMGLIRWLHKPGFYYTEINHQAFSGKNETKHYFDIASGPVSGEDVPYKEVSLDFVMKRGE